MALPSSCGRRRPSFTAGRRLWEYCHTARFRLVGPAFRLDGCTMAYSDTPNQKPRRWEQRRGTMDGVGKNAGARVLIYSHDSFGLGHLRRCRTIAHALVERFKDASVLILSGSPIIGSFDYRARVDFVRVPGVIKLRNGEYTSLNLHIDIEETLNLRASIIQHTAEIFDPDLFIVDKEPVGLRGEVLPTLKALKRRGTRLVLGDRDVMDEPRLLEPEWQRKKALPALREL